MRTCDVEGCDKKHLANGYCSGHNYQLQRGKPLTPLRAYIRDKHCSVDGCDKKHHSKGYCEKHHARYRRHGDPLVTHKVMDNRGTDNLTYGGSHGRVSRTRGRAVGYDCVDCGGPADEWSYNHQDPNELRAVISNNKGYQYEVPYSANPDHYDPRCKPCNVAFDAGRAYNLTTATN